LAELYQANKGGGSDFSAKGSLSETVFSATMSLNQAKVKELEAQLMSAILMGEENSLKQLLNNVLVDMAANSLEEMHIQALSLSIALHRTIQNKLETEVRDPVTGFTFDIPRTDWTTAEVIGWAGEQVNQFLQLITNWQASKSESMIEKAIKYIEEKYSSEIRLMDVAGHVHLNPSYFSVLFKKVTGETLTRYITRYRMEKAALLLRNTDMKIFEIACAVGFDEPNYFTNVFKQQYQMSPKEYRSS
jgi:two-component system response regulator YesN